MRHESGASEKLRSQLASTWEHTKKVLDNLISLVFNPDEFNRTYSVDISTIPISSADAENLAVVAFIHDLWKLVTPTDHAEKGGQFLTDQKNVIAVRFHDRFGIIHTGEAPLLFLDELAMFLRTIPDDAKELLNRLRIMTIIDVAAYGYLNQARVDTYEYLIGLLQEVPDASQFEKKARGDTTKRIKRLVEANNRATIDEKVVSAALAAFKHSKELEDLLVYSRLDYGAYSLEPMFRKIIGEGYKLDQTTVVTVNENSQSVVISFLQCLFDVLTLPEWMSNLITMTETRVGERTLKTYHLTKLSIKDNKNITVFEEWASHY